ncbi:hypothetical protein GOBAR_AA37567 [Gossypium barbadense]|uniref:Uncharacterized protein n=1 Tax=Gossypium barbadense TaxID=3634 RepID=A0A2P5VWC8_GOSBA|nr:hypothetical protein GOBAR_AA37567 [Gossypium barbadense]
MTPKTKRLPKPGEILLSVHGSPLGVYKEENMEAIHGPGFKILARALSLRGYLISRLDYLYMAGLGQESEEG